MSYYISCLKMMNFSVKFIISTGNLKRKLYSIATTVLVIHSLMNAFIKYRPFHIQDVYQRNDYGNDIQ